MRFFMPCSWVGLWGWWVDVRLTRVTFWPITSGVMRIGSCRWGVPLIFAVSKICCCASLLSCCSFPSANRSVCNAPFFRFGISSWVNLVLFWRVSFWRWLSTISHCFWSSLSLVSAFGALATYQGLTIVFYNWTRFVHVTFSWPTSWSHRRWTTVCTFRWVISFRWFFVCRCFIGFWMSRITFLYWFRRV